MSKDIDACMADLPLDVEIRDGSGRRSSCRIEPFLIPPDSDEKRGEGFWDEYVAAPSAMHVICRR